MTPIPINSLTEDDMSCCDGSLIYISNQTSGNNAQTFTVLATSTDNSTGLSGIAVGDTIAPNGSLKGSVQSADGSNGAAEGQIQIGYGSYTFNLNYDFKPKNEFGKCPCTPNGSSSPQSAGPYKINVSNTKGENSGAVLNFYVNS
jgi:hypothetical protein